MVLKKSKLTSGRPFFGQNIDKHVQRPMTPSRCATRPCASNLILKKVDSMSNESPNKILQDARANYWAKYRIGEELQSSGPSVQPQRAVGLESICESDDDGRHLK
jgi:hypothetical protein